MPTVHEFRRHPRIESRQLPLGIFEEGRRLSGVEINDISFGGMGVLSSERLSEGQEIDFSVVLPGGEMKGRGVVRWAQPFDLGYRGGVEFKKLGFWQRRRLGSFVGGTLEWGLKTRAAHFFDWALITGTVAVTGLIVLDRFGVSLRDLSDLARFFAWL